MILSVNIDGDMIRMLLQELRNLRDKDKKSVCSILYLADKNIQDWYHTLVRKYAEEKATIIGQEIPNKDQLSKLLHFMMGRKNSHANTYASYCLVDIINDYESGRLRRLVDNLDINRIREISRLIDEFHSKVFSTDWQLRIEDAGYGELKVKDITDWLNTLDELREKIGGLATSIRVDLKCGPEAFK
jgi:hypothetical protein